MYHHREWVARGFKSHSTKPVEDHDHVDRYNDHDCAPAVYVVIPEERSEDLLKSTDEIASSKV